MKEILYYGHTICLHRRVRMGYKKIFLVRHGQTTMNVKGIYQGRVNSDLTSLGIQQTKGVGKYIHSKEIVFKDIYCSTSPRAIDTCKLIIETMGKNAVKTVKYDNRLVEMDFGIFEGQSIELCKTNYPHTYYDLYHHPQDYAPLGDGETVQQVIDRVSHFLSDLKNDEHKDAENVLVVTHGVIIRAIFYCLLHRKIEDFWIDEDIPSSSLTILSKDDNRAYRIDELFITCH